METGRKLIINGKQFEVVSCVEDKNHCDRTHLLAVKKPSGKKCWMAGLDMFSGRCWLICTMMGGGNL